MKSVAVAILLSATLLSLLSRGLALDVYLVNITIYTDHEKDFLWKKNHPEVYLSCNDGRPVIKLEHVNDEHRPYLFEEGDVVATTVERDGPCVQCRLKEEDPSILRDDTFGDFPLCWHQFKDTADYLAYVPDHFRMGFRCPDCLNVDRAAPVVAPEEEIYIPAPEPEDGEDELEYEIDAAAPSVVEIEKDEEKEDPIGQYYYFTSPGRTFSIENGDQEVGLQSGEEKSPEVDLNGGSSNGLSTATVLSLCFVFLVVGVAVGVLFFWKYSAKIANDRAVATAFEMTKIGFIKKGKI